MGKEEATGFDVVVIGCGPAGERAAIYAARAGKRVAVIERGENPGGARVLWGTIPSKTLRESARIIRGLSRGSVYGIQCAMEGPLTVNDFMYHEKEVVRLELDLILQALERNGIQLLRGHGKLVGPNRVAILGQEGQTRMQIDAGVIIISTGTTPNRPADVPFDEHCIFDSDGILTLDRIPKSMIVLGAGVIGVEYACIFAALGVEVTLVNTRDTLLPFLDREVADVLEEEMRRQGIVVLHGDHYAKIEKHRNRKPNVRCTTRNGNLLEAETMLYCVGRDGNTKNMGLEDVGIQPNRRGLLEVNEFYQTALPHVYAAGDIIGYPALASTSMEQGRQAIRHALDLPGPTGLKEAFPSAIFSLPELSTIGETEESLKKSGTAYIVGRGHYALNARAQILGDTGGLLKLLFEAESMKLVGVHIVGTDACELISVGHAYLRLGSTAEQISTGIFNYPSLADLYRHAALEASAAFDLAHKGQPRTSIDEHYYLEGKRKRGET